MSTARQSLVPNTRKQVEREYNPVKHARSLRYGSTALHLIAIVLMGLVLMLLPQSEGQERMMVLASVLNHAELCVGIFCA